MKKIKLLRIKRPCSKCLYKLGIIHFLISPCPACKKNGYQAFKQFKKQQPEKGLTS